MSRDSPYTQNALIRCLDSPFRMLSDTDGEAARAFDLLTDREGMAVTSRPWRWAFVVDGDRTVTHRWVAEDWVLPVPRECVETAIAAL